MSRINRKSGLALTPSVFRALHKALILALKEKYQVLPETLVDYQLYGFNYYDENLPSIKKLILDTTGQWVNGKYLYNKHREWKKGITSIKFTREFVFVYFKTLGYSDLKDFMLNSALSETEIAAQIGLEKPIAPPLQNEYYVGFFIGEEGNAISTRLTLYENSLKAQLFMAYWEKEEAYSEYTYEGTIQYQQNGMSLFFKNEDTDLDRSLFIAIFCERQVKVKPFLIGAYSGYDRNRQPVIGEMFFQRVDSEEEQQQILKTKKTNPIIAQHITGRRWITLGKTIQNLKDLSPESKFAAIIEQFVKPYRGVFMTIENGVFIIELIIQDNLGNASLRIAGHPLYKGIFKVQASGQLLIGQFTNDSTKAPLFMSIEVLPIREHLYTGDLLGVSRFDKSFSGKTYLSSGSEVSEELPTYRGAELTADEIQSLPNDILSDLTNIFKNNKLEKHLQITSSPNKSSYLHHLAGKYEVQYHDENQQEKIASLSIEESGKSTLYAQHLSYEGNAMMCEGTVLSIYFTHCNGIPHCGQIMGKIGRKSKKELVKIEASWHLMDENFNSQLKKIRITTV